MQHVRIAAQKDFIEGLTSSAPVKAVAELIWNGLDAGAQRVEVILDRNVMDGLETIRVQDTGVGIDPNMAATHFGNLGDSWKRVQQRFKGRSLHGKNGKGRLKAFSLGNRVEWNTTFQQNGHRVTYKISGASTALDSVAISDPTPADARPTGTETVISGVKQSADLLLGEAVADELAKLFAAYLSQYPEVAIVYDTAAIAPLPLQECQKHFTLDDIELTGGRKATATVSIIEWKLPTPRAIHLCDANGVALHETEAGVQIPAPGFHFTAYIKSDLFRDLDKENQLILADLHPDVDTILKRAKGTIKGYFRKRLAERQSAIVERWKKEEIYPYLDASAANSVEEVERQVFDILAVNVETYLPAFEGADSRSRKFMFRLLAQALRQNPASVQQIITEVLSLKEDEQKDLAELLEKTSLSAIISAAKIAANRLDFVLGLENLVFDKTTKDVLLERDQLHKILETEAWIFREEFALSASEQRLEEVLELHRDKLGHGEDSPEPVLLEGGKQGRIDLLLSRVTQPRHGEFDYLVVELKRPSQNIDSKVLSQIEAYAIAVAAEARFRGQDTRWTFMAVSNEMDEYAERKARQRGRPKGLIFDDSEHNITVWAKTWSEVISDARSRLQFVNTQLVYEADRESSTKYLKKAHAKFIPDVETPVPPEVGEPAGQSTPPPAPPPTPSGDTAPSDEGASPATDQPT